MYNNKKNQESLISKQWFKSNILSFFIGLIVSLVITVSATVALQSSQVRYNNDESVETAINELYQKVDEIKYTEMKKIGCDQCTKLEYLESTGTQYIDTEITAQDNLTVIITFQTLSVDLWQVVAGSNYSLSMYVKNNSIAVAGNIVNDWFPQSNNIFKDVEFGTKIFPNRYFKYNNDERTQNRSREPGYKVFLFGLNDNNNLFSNNGLNSSTPAPFQGRIYVVNMYLNDNLVRDYIPVLDKNNRPCLFDKVSKECFYNQGTGEFLYG